MRGKKLQKIGVVNLEMADWKCPFCGSKELKIKSGYVELKEDGSTGPIENFCCFAQKQNFLHAKKSYGADYEYDPDKESKL